MTKKAIIITAVTVPLLVVVGVRAFSNVEPAATEQPKAYAFTELGSRCSSGAASYTIKAQALTTQADKDNTAIQAEIAKTQAKSESNASYNTQGLNSARQDYLAIYNSGGMTYEEYRDKVAQLDRAQATAGTPSGSIQSELNRIQTEATRHHEESKQKAAGMEGSAAKLQSCADSAKAERDFTASDVAEFEALISGSF